MLIAVGILLALTGTALFAASLLRTVRANPDSRIPWLGEPPVVPKHEILQRALGAGLTVGGAAMFGIALSAWVGVSVAVVIALGACAVVLRHNRRVRAAA
ncbi:hypothetical protein [Microbacterium sp. G2-8]|uniref:hypothetical protein n=1 Tax=Microbacterium sp. G2-8 TaxID=2842454 RepID=UPI001C899815|nr:hypothetical protein [Microbacterium sp. G2-8]